MNIHHTKYFCLSLISLLITCPRAIAAQENAIALNNTEHLSLIQQLERLDSREVNIPIYLSKSSQSREYTFKAPGNKTLNNSGNLTAIQGYKVEVYGNEQVLLQEVRNVEPKAFIKGDLIQVGIFSQQNNAEDMVKKLASKGLWARIITQ